MDYQQLLDKYKSLTSGSPEDDSDDSVPVVAAQPDLKFASSIKAPTFQAPSTPVSPTALNPMSNELNEKNILNQIEANRVSSGQQLLDARKQLKDQQIYNSIIGGVNKIAGGYTSLNSNAPVKEDDSFLQELENNEKKNVENVQGDTKSKMTGLLSDYARLREMQKDRKDLSKEQFEEKYKMKDLDMKGETNRLIRLQRQDSIDYKHDQDALKRATLSPKETDEITSLQSALDEAKTIQGLKPKFNTGPASNTLNTVAEKVGLDDADKSAFRSRVELLSSKLAAAMNKGRMTKNALDFFRANKPSFAQDDSTFDKKLSDTIDIIQHEMSNRLTGLKHEGRDVSEYQQDNVQANKTPEAQKSLDATKNKVKVSNGKEILLIDPSDLKDAEADGYRSI